MKIPCDTIARLSHVLGDPASDIDECFKHFRLENGMIMASNRAYLVMEEVEKFEGVYYIKGDPTLIEQCRTEAQWNSVIEFTPVDAIQYTTAMTTFGFSVSENIGWWPGAATEFDRWRSVVDMCRDPLTATTGHMTLDLTSLQQLVKASPSGVVTLEQHLDPRNRPTCVRDSDTYDWVAFFRPSIKDGRSHVAASVPTWCR